VKYVILIYSNPTTWAEMPAAERARALGVHHTMIKALNESGELLRVDGLADPRAAKTIRARGGVPVVTDGQFCEAKVFVAGVWAIDVESLQRALEVAAPVAEYDTVEVRELMDLSGMEM
jgi:hypothetical protein